MKKLLFLAVAWFCLVGQAEESKPLDTVEAVRDRILAVLKDIDYSKDFSSELPPLKVSEVHEIAVEAEGYLMAGRFDQLESLLEEHFDSRQMNHDGEFVYSQIHEEVTRNASIIDFLNEWCKKVNVPHFAYLLRAEWFIKEAWRDRGGGWASTVRGEGWNGFSENLKLARADLEKAYKLNPNDYIVSRKMITVCMGSGSSHKELIKWFERSVKANYLYFGSYYSFAWAMSPRWGGSTDILRPYFDYLIEYSPKGGRIYIELPRWYTWDFKDELKDPESLESKVSKELINRFIKEFPQSTYGWYLLADLAFEQSRNKDGLKYVNQGLELDQIDYLYEVQGNCFWVLKNMSAALKSYKKATELNPYNYFTWYNLGRLYSKVRADYTTAIECFNEALKLNPNYINAKKLRALTYCYRGDLDLALDAWQRLLETRDQDEWIYHGRGLTYWCMGKYDLADKDFEKSISIDPAMKKAVTWYKKRLKKVEDGKPMYYGEFLRDRAEKKKAVAK